MSNTMSHLHGWQSSSEVGCSLIELKLKKKSIYDVNGIPMQILLEVAFWLRNLNCKLQIYATYDYLQIHLCSRF